MLEDVSFRIEAGESVAYVGPTGAGKSSVINLLNRFYIHQKGRILIDGRPIETYSLPALRQHIGIVLQDVFLFSDTLRNNVTLYADGVEQHRLDAAAKAVGADEFIRKLPEGWGQNVRERGEVLSVGQRQLIAFMRAYLAQPAILVLDEATSSIDSESEQLIQRATAAITKNRTSLIVAHRLSTIRHANRIIVLDQGKLIQSGTHDELMGEEGMYQDLVFSQIEVD